MDTVSTEDFVLNKEGVNVQLQLCENKITKKYEIRVKARRTGGLINNHSKLERIIHKSFITEVIKYL